MEPCNSSAAKFKLITRKELERLFVNGPERNIQLPHLTCRSIVRKDIDHVKVVAVLHDPAKDPVSLPRCLRVVLIRIPLLRRLERGFVAMPKVATAAAILPSIQEPASRISKKGQKFFMRRLWVQIRAELQMLVRLRTKVLRAIGREVDRVAHFG